MKIGDRLREGGLERYNLYTLILFLFHERSSGKKE